MRPFEPFRLHVLQQRWKIPCARSTTYNYKHQEEMNGRICPYKHFLYHWTGRLGNEVTLLSDSICKWMQYIPHVETQAVPGINLTRTLAQLQDVNLTSRGYRGIILI